jgi:PBP1b-binding outer membrane lipoprotein LpoB
MKNTLTGLTLLVFVFTACSSNDETTAKTKDKYEQTKETLEETEKENPKRFLTVSGQDKKNLIRQTVIKGTISNNAKVVSYKDVDVELSFFSKTGALLEKDHEVIYETIAPGNTADFKTKYYAPKGTDSVALKILGARTE